MVPWTQPTQKGRPKKDFGVDTPALSLLGPQKSPMREYPGGCPGGRVPKKGTQPTQKGRPQKDRIPIPKRGMWEYPGERNTPGGKTPGEKDRTPECSIPRISTLGSQSSESPSAKCTIQISRPELKELFKSYFVKRT